MSTTFQCLAFKNSNHLAFPHLPRPFIHGAVGLGDFFTLNHNTKNVIFE